MVDTDPSQRHDGDLHPVEKEFISEQLDVFRMRSLAMRANLLHPRAIRGISFAGQQTMMTRVSERVDQAQGMDERFGLFLDPSIGNLLGSVDLSSVDIEQPDPDFDQQKLDFRAIQAKYGIVTYSRESRQGNPEWYGMDVHDVNGTDMAVLVRDRPVGTLIKPDRLIHVEKRSLLLARNIDKFQFLIPDGYQKPADDQPADYFINPTTQLAFDPRKVQHEIDSGYSPDLKRIQVALFAHVYYPDYRD